ncbi:hypothetical protein HDU67_005634 [Dinochytrium kinnereticum]|nr:hypothetical protein HDU67_005634 [Dinochytrium kinnereticum]
MEEERKTPVPARRMSLAVALMSAKRPSINHTAPKMKDENYIRMDHPENAAVQKRPGRLGALEMIRSLDPSRSHMEGRKIPNTEEHSSGNQFEEMSDSESERLLGLTAVSAVQEFRLYHQDIPHPATVLNLVADEQDRDIYSVFDELCNELLCALGDFEASLEEMTIWKDDFLTQTVPSNVKLQLTLLFSRLFRRQNHILDISIRKLENLQFQLNKFKSERRIVLWERLARRMLGNAEEIRTSHGNGCKNEQQDEAVLDLSVARQIQIARSHAPSRQNDYSQLQQESRPPSNLGGRHSAESEHHDRSRSRRRGGKKGKRSTTASVVSPNGNVRKTVVDDYKPGEVEIISDSEDDLDSYSSGSENSTTDDSAASDYEYFGNINSEELGETLSKFIGDSHESQSESTGLDTQKGCFSLQDVMELTLLHAQQLQLLQSEYEERISGLEASMEDLRRQHETSEMEHEQKIRQMQERAQRIAREYMRSVTEAPLQIPERENMAAEPSDEPYVLQEPDRDGKYGNSRKKSKKHSKIKRTVREQKNNSIRVEHSMKRNEYTVRKKPTFTSAPFAMSFLERLRWFTEEKLKNRTHLQGKFTALEMAANEERLEQLRLLNRGSMTEAPQPFNAEFLPYPGSLPVTKARDIWAEQGIATPWGGRFMQQGERDAQPLNILNLFDVAIRSEGRKDVGMAQREPSQNQS